MKIALISLYCRFGGTTGDCVQADKTAKALSALGEDVLRCYLKPETSEIYDSRGDLLGKWGEVLEGMDVVHAIPPIPSVFLPSDKIRAKLVASTIFWRSLTYSRVLHRSDARLSFGVLKDYVRTFFSWFNLPTYKSYLAYDILLPNSIDEIDCFKRYCRLKRGAKIKAVPNAIDPIPCFVDDLARPDDIPNGDYVLVPAVFAARKNHLALIRALRGFKHMIVFMGDGPMLERCRAEATPNMLFLGHVPQGSPDFYALMKYARVVCLPSNCETPGIAGLEAAALGARPVVPREGGTVQYYGWEAEYLNPLDDSSIKECVERAFEKGRLSEVEMARYRRMTWELVARMTRDAYRG